jgi:hypothetical protein
LAVSQGKVKKELTLQHPHVPVAASNNSMRAEKISLKCDTGILPELINKFQTRLKSDNSSHTFHEDLHVFLFTSRYHLDQYIYMKRKIS